MMPDYGHEAADKGLKQLEKDLKSLYLNAAVDMQEKARDFMRDFERKDEQMRALVEEGKWTEEQYNTWRRNQMMTEKRMQDMTDQLAKDLANTDKIAAGMINNTLPSAYAENYNFGTYEIETGTTINTSFTLYDKKTVENLMKADPKIIPQARVNIPEDERWNRKKLTSAIAQGILQGESIPKIANRLQNVAAMDRNAAIRNARTYTTAAENKGRVDSIARANDMGIPADQEWLATLDDRTRMEHRHLDGQTRPVGEPFEADGYRIMYPGDPDAEPEMIYNCRCTLVSRVRGRIYNDERNDSKLDGMSYEEWKHAKDRQMEPPKQEETQKEETLRTENQKDYEYTKRFIENNNLTYREVGELEEKLTGEEIIQKLSGGDMTQGSCASLALAYIGNQQGLDVTDFQGGNSRATFSRFNVWERAIRTADADVTFRLVKNEAKDTAALLRELPKDREYVLSAGKHASIVRNSEEFGLQFLELQSATLSGWTPFDQTIEFYGLTQHLTVEDTLKERFGCRKSVKRLAGDVVETPIALAPVDSFKKTEEFKEILGYINTDPGKQQKGEKGGIK